MQPSTGLGLAPRSTASPLPAPVAGTLGEATAGGLPADQATVPSNKAAHPSPQAAGSPGVPALPTSPHLLSSIYSEDKKEALLATGPAPQASGGMGAVCALKSSPEFSRFGAEKETHE